MSKITVDMFCKTYKAQSKGNTKTFYEFLQKHIVTDYIPYLTKDAYCTNIVDVTSHINEGNRSIIKINNSMRYMLFTMKLIELYTDIDITFEDGKFINQYDELNKIGAIDMLIGGVPDEGVEFIPIKEYSEFSTILNMKLDDLRDNEYSVVAMIYNLKNSLSLSEDVISAALKEVAKEE